MLGLELADQPRSRVDGDAGARGDTSREPSSLIVSLTAAEWTNIPSSWGVTLETS